MGDIKVINAGFLTTVQDKGRIGYQEFGMPVAGAMDEFSLRLGNILLKNDEYEAALEVTMLGPELKFNIDTVVSITGADIQPKINNIEVQMWRTIKINKGDRLSFGKCKNGLRCYICFLGGIDVPDIMRSKSTYIKAKIGGVHGRALKVGDEIDLINKKTYYKEVLNRKIKDSYIPNYTGNYNINIVLGPQEESFTKEGLNTLTSSTYEVTNQCDRMGYRLTGEK